MAKETLATRNARARAQQSKVDIEYDPDPMPDGMGKIEVSEYTPYEGLEPFFTRVMTLEGSSPAQRQGLTLMLMELDSALQAQEGGDHAQAVRHHKQMLDHAKDALKNSTPAAQKIFTEITSAVRDQSKPWGATLAAIVENYKRTQQAEQNLSLLPAGVTKATFYVDAPVTLAAKTAVKSARSQSRAEARAEARAELLQLAPKFFEPAQHKKDTTSWVRQEYKNLGIVLDEMSRPGQPGRVDAMLALSSLRTMNAQEREFLSDQRNGVKNDGRRNETFTAARQKLAQAMTKLERNERIRDAAQVSLARWKSPAVKHARLFERISQGPGTLMRAFYAAASFFSTHIMPAVKAVAKSPVPVPLAR